MEITIFSNEDVVREKFQGKWVNISFLDNKSPFRVFVVSVDNDYEDDDYAGSAIYYNNSGANDYADEALPFSQIQSIELSSTQNDD